MGGRTSNESKAKYNAKAYDRINIAVAKGTKDILQAVAKSRGQSINSYICMLIDEALQQEAMQGGTVSGNAFPADGNTVYVGSSPTPPLSDNQEPTTPEINERGG